MTEEEEKVDATTHGGAGAEQPYPSPPPIALSRKLRRSRSHRMFAGVAGGLGEYFGADPILFRLGFAILTFLGGAGIGLYLAAWILIPEEGEEHSLGEVGLAKAKVYVEQRDQSWIWITLLVIGGLIVISNLGRMGWDTGAVFWAVLLIAGGIWLYNQDRTGGRPPGDAPPTRPVAGDPPPARPAVAPTTRPVDASGYPGQSAASVTEPLRPARSVAAPAPAAPKVKAPRSNLGRYTFALTLVVIGILAMLDNGEVLEMGPAGYGAATLATIGAGLLVGSIWGRARGLIFWGLLLVPFVLISDAAEVDLSAGVDKRIFTPDSPAELAESHELMAGRLLFDLSRMEWGTEPVTIDAKVSMGQVEVWVPEGVDVDFDGHVEMGRLELFEQRRDGRNVSLNSAGSTEGAGPQLVLNAEVYMGEIEVTRTGTPAKELS
jgi:phage shock protein PspC (stress-responsive transcriptional regulator)